MHVGVVTYAQSMQVARRKFVWKVGAWWAAGFLCEAFAFASGAQVSNSNNYLRISAVFLLAAACFFHVPVLGANFRSLYRSCMITWVALDAASQNLRRSEAPNRFPQRRFFSSPSMPAASGGDSPGHIALTPIGPSSSRATNVAYAQNLGRVNPPARQHTNNAAQQERASDFFKVHLQLALVTVATSVHASLLLAPAANLLLASTGSSSIGSSAQHVTALRILLLCAIVLAWGVAVCVRWNVIYGVAVSCVLLSLPVGQGVLSMVHTDNNWLDIKVGEPLWASMSRSPRLLACVVFVALGVLLFVAVGHHFLEQLFSPRDNEGYGGVLGSSGYLGSEALEEPLAGNGTSGQLQQVRQPVHSFHSFEMNALMDDDSELESM